MNAAAWERAKSLLVEAADLPAGDRERYVMEHCPDPELRREVLDLLASPAPLSEILLAGAPTTPATTKADAGSDNTPAAGLPNVDLSPLDDARFAPGRIFASRFRIVSLLGRGAMGEVYRAEDLRVGQPVALKLLSARGAIGKGALDRFVSEVRLARGIVHPNVCRVFDIGEADGWSYLSMEYVDGETLASVRHRIGRLPS